MVSTLLMLAARRASRKLEEGVPPPWSGARGEERVPVSSGVGFLQPLRRSHPSDHTPATDLFNTHRASASNAGFVHADCFCRVSPAAGPKPSKEKEYWSSSASHFTLLARTRKMILWFFSNCFSSRPLWYRGEHRTEGRRRLQGP